MIKEKEHYELFSIGCSRQSKLRMRP